MNAINQHNTSVQIVSYRDQNSPGGVVEKETGQIGVKDGSDCGTVTTGERRREGGRERRRDGGREGGRDGGREGNMHQ